MPVRNFVKDDIPQVADLYWTVMRERKGSAPPAVHSFLHELYFTNPWIDNRLPSLVFAERGRIAGFLGVIPRRMSLGGQSIRVAFGGNFAVHPEFRTTLAGLHLLRTYLAGGQDLSQTDSANDTSRSLLERMGFTTILPFSVHWVRPLRPARCVTRALSHLAATTLSTCLEFAARRFCSTLDRMAKRLSFSPFRLPKSPLQAAELDIETLLACLRESRSGYSLWSEYDARSLRWLLSFMERMKGHGKELRKVVVRDDGRKTIGRDNVISLEPGKRIRTTKNVTGSEIQFLGHFPEQAVMPGTLIVEAIGQSASILFSKTTGTGTRPGEFLMLGSINEMRFLKAVIPGDRMEIDVQVLKFIEDYAVIEGVATVDGAEVARGKLGFARLSLAKP